MGKSESCVTSIYKRSIRHVGQVMRDQGFGKSM